MCTKIPQDSERAIQAAEMASVAKEKMTKGASAVGQEARALESHDVAIDSEGEDSAAMKEALHNVASRNGEPRPPDAALRDNATQFRGPEASSDFPRPAAGGVMSLPGAKQQQDSRTVEAAVEDAPEGAGRIVPSEQDDDALLLAAPPEEEDRSEPVPETSLSDSASVDATSGARSLIIEPQGEQVDHRELIRQHFDEAVRDGRLDKDLRPALEEKFLETVGKSKHMDPEKVLGLIEEILVKVECDESLSDVEREILMQGYTKILENRGIHRDAEGNVAIFGRNGMEATSGALNEKFLEALPTERQRQAREHIAKGRVRVISHEELEAHRRAGAVIAEQIYSKIASDYQAFKKQLAEDKAKDERDKAEAAKTDENSRLRKHDLIHPSVPKFLPQSDKSKESLEAIRKKEDETAAQRKNVPNKLIESKIQKNQAKKSREQKKIEIDQQKQIKTEKEINVDEQKKQEPPHTPDKRPTDPLR